MSFTKCGRFATIKLPEAQDCILLSESIFCIDPRLDEISIRNITDFIKISESLDEDQKLDLIKYFEDNKEDIIKTKEFEIGLDHLGFFRGYFMTSPLDREELELSINDNLGELDKWRRKCGKYRTGRIICK